MLKQEGATLGISSSMQKSSWWTDTQLTLDWKAKGWTSLIWAMIWATSATFLQTACLLLLSRIIFFSFVISTSSPPIVNTNHLSPYSPMPSLNKSRHAKLTWWAKVIKMTALKQKEKIKEMCTVRRGSNQRTGFHHNGSVDEECAAHTGHVLLGFQQMHAWCDTKG